MCVGIASHIEHELDWLVKLELEPGISGSTWPQQYCLVSIGFSCSVQSNMRFDWDYALSSPSSSLMMAAHHLRLIFVVPMFAYLTQPV